MRNGQVGGELLGDLRLFGIADSICGAVWLFALSVTFPGLGNNEVRKTTGHVLVPLKGKTPVRSLVPTTGI